MSKEPQNDLTGTVSRQPELEPAAAPIGGIRWLPSGTAIGLPYDRHR
jgi:hypothetical protein